VACPFSAALVEQLHPDVLPDRMGSVDAQHRRSGFPRSDDRTAAQAQDVSGDFGQSALLDGNAATDLTALIPE
jgi:hypothetical protein